jgi:hypothetical protein
MQLNSEHDQPARQRLINLCTKVVRKKLSDNRIARA